MIADYSRNQYVSADISGAGFGRGALSGSYQFVPDAIRWNADIAYEQQRSDLIRPLAPGNTEDVIRMSTGPTLTTRLGGAMEGLLDARYSRIAFSTSPFDNEIKSLQARLQRRANPRSVIGVAVSHEDVAYLSGTGPNLLDYRRQEGFLIANINGVRTRIEAEAGLGRAKGESIQDESPMFRVRLTRRLTPFISGYAGYRQEYPTSAGANLTTDPAAPAPIPIDGIEDRSILTAGPRQAKTAEIGVGIERPRSQASLTFLRTREASLVPGIGTRAFDQIRVQVNRDFSPSARGSIYGGFSSEGFSLLPEFKEKWFGAEFAYDFSSAIGVDVRVERRNRSAEIAVNEYSEVTGGIFLRYSGGFGRQQRQRQTGAGP
jgi:hypothetical protein